MLKSKLISDPIYFFIDKVEKHVKNLFEESTQFNIRNRFYIEQMYNNKIKWSVDKMFDHKLRVGIETCDGELPLSAIIFCLYQLSVGCGVDSKDWNNNYIDEIMIRQFKTNKSNYISTHFILEY